MLDHGEQPSGGYCAHNQTLAMINSNGMVITGWRLIGPISEARAQDIVRCSDAAALAIEMAVTHQSDAH
jgi:hypothetical protein